MAKKLLKVLPGAAQDRQGIFRLTQEQIRRFSGELRSGERAEATAKKYCSDAQNFYDYLDEDKWVYADSLERWKQSLVDSGYMPRTVNGCVVSINSLFHFLGYRQLQHFNWIEIDATAGDEQEDAAPTRAEYITLLQTAKDLGNMQTYLLIKVLACLPLGVGDLAKLTREAVEAGALPCMAGREQQDAPIPRLLKEELLAFAASQGIACGPIFLSARGKPLNRCVAYMMLSTLAEEADIPKAKATPLGLRKLYKQTMDTLRTQADIWMRRNYDGLLEEEEAVCGWYGPRQPWRHEAADAAQAGAKLA